MATTYTVTQTWAQPPRVMPEGAASWRAFNVSMLVQGVVGDTIKLAKLPPVCDILGCWIRGTAPGDSDMLMELRAGATAIGATLTSTTIAASGAAGIGGDLGVRPFRAVSISDDAAVQYAALQLVVTTASTQTATLSLAGWVMYQVGDSGVV